MLKVVRLQQYWGRYNPTSKYEYLIDDPVIGMLVSDGQTYVGKIIEISEDKVPDLECYKETHLIDYNKVKATLYDIRYNFLIKEHQRSSARWYANLKRDGGYYDPNLGWVSVSEEEIDEYVDTFSPPQQEICKYVEEVASNLIPSPIEGV